jgi:hypothetical protein
MEAQARPELWLLLSVLEKKGQLRFVGLPYTPLVSPSADLLNKTIQLAELFGESPRGRGENWGRTEARKRAMRENNKWKERKVHSFWKMGHACNRRADFHFPIERSAVLLNLQLQFSKLLVKQNGR